MSNDLLKEFIGALNAETPVMPLHQARLKQSLPHMSPGTHHKKEPFMKRNKKILGFSTVGMTLAIAASVVVYSYHYSPKALADEMIGRGFTTLSSLEPGKMSALQEQFGGDPAEALKEAKLANDARVITKAEFDEESKNAKGLFATSLSKDGTSPMFSMQRMNGPDGSAESGAVSLRAQGTAQAVGSAGAVQIKDGEVTTISNSATTMPAPPEGAGVIMHTEGSANFSTSGGATPVAGTMATPVPADLKNLSTVQIMSPSEATSFLRYTDKNGRVNVLSLDKDGLPIFRTIFMTGTDVPMP